MTISNENNTVQVYSNGLCYCSVCVKATMSREDIVKEVNNLNPSGTHRDWTISAECFQGGEFNPRPCEQDCTRLHFLMEC